MKISLSWVARHLDNVLLSQINIDTLIQEFNTKVAEIEGVTPVHFDLNNLFVAKTQASNSEHKVKVEISELNQILEIDKPAAISHDKYYLVQRQSDEFSFAKFADFQVEKEGFLPAVSLPESWLKGDWKKHVTAYDQILHIDNKSITHRPDMWSHRGFAREIGALLKFSLIPTQNLIADQNISQKKSLEIFSIKNSAAGCKAFSIAQINNLTNQDSDLSMVFDLLRIGQKPINLLVDLTNYLLQDWGQPVHAYDQDKLYQNNLEARLAQDGETITLLDRQEYILTSNDLVIASGKPVALAGIMGGLDSSVSLETKNIIFESATFDADQIRKTSMKNHLRTESSARFEKSLDIARSKSAILRFIKLLELYNVPHQVIGIQLSDQKEEKITIEISHDQIEKNIGLSIPKEFVQKTLEKLEFQINNHNDVYQIEVPDFRATKDVQEPHDIIEEIARYFGFDNITPVVPEFAKLSSSKKSLDLRSLKKLLSYGFGMVEQCNYPMLDENFCAQINYNPELTLNIVNPVSSDYYRLAPSLVPGLLKNIRTNSAMYDELAFFEIAQTWTRQSHTSHKEQKTLCGVWFAKKHKINFYEKKAQVQNIFQLINTNKIPLWKKQEDAFEVWQSDTQTATLQADGQVLGHAGMVNPTLLLDLGYQPTASAFFFQINLDACAAFNLTEQIFENFSTQQPTYFDVACMLDAQTEVTSLKEKILQLDPQFSQVYLVDLFSKAEWNNQRSAAFRIILQQSSSKTETAGTSLTKQDIVEKQEKVLEHLQTWGYKVRD